MDIILTNTSDEPIYQQIVTQIKAYIMNGTLCAGDALPSMRMLAQQLRDGFIESFAGKGCFVKGQNTEFLREEHIRQTEELLSKACERAKQCDLSLEDMKEMLELVYGGTDDE